MAHWFHRNPLKATAPVSFNLYGVASSRGAVRICNELRTSRARLLEAFSDAASTPELVRAAAAAYFSLLQGFIVAQPPDAGTAEEPPENKMRFVQKFTWTDTLQGNEAKPGAQRDAVFELASMAFNVALWYTKSASRLAGKEDVTEAEAKDIHRGLRVAAGIFRHLRDVQVPRLVAVAPPAVGGEGGGLLRDLEARVLDAYEAQCLAEAQEVTIARAVALKHEASLVAALSLETAELYRTAERALGAPEPAQCGGKWRKYLQLKRSFYVAHAFCYHAQTLLAADKCGESIRCLQKAEQCYGRAEALCKDYRRTRGPGSTAKPSEQLFFLRLGRIIGDTLAKSQRENDFIYFHKVPAEEPRLELKASYGLAEPLAFQLPGLSELCTAEALAAFDLAKRARPDKSGKTAAKPEEEEVKPVKEPDMKPQKDTGCVLS